MQAGEGEERGRREYGCWKEGSQDSKPHPLPFLSCCTQGWRVIGDRARSSGSGGWDQDREKPAVGPEVYRGTTRSNCVGTKTHVSRSHRTQGLLV